MRGVSRMVRLALLLGLVWFAIGGVKFANRVANATPDAFLVAEPGQGGEVDPRVDAIVALTGGGGARIRQALTLLEQDHAGRLLISGVHPDTSVGDLQRLTGRGGDIFACCVDIGRVATTTRGNALEIAEWVAKNGYRRVVIVTSDFHMPRSLVEIETQVPDVELVAYPVSSQRERTPIWLDGKRLRKVSVEYVKYVAISLQPPEPLGRDE